MKLWVIWNTKLIHNVDNKERKIMILYCCEEHVDMALDEVVYECETYPILTSVADEENLSTACEYCQNRAIYIVAN